MTATTRDLDGWGDAADIPAGDGAGVGKAASGLADWVDAEAMVVACGGGEVRVGVGEGEAVDHVRRFL